MTCCPYGRVVSLVLFGLGLALVAGLLVADRTTGAVPNAANDADWPMYGGTPARNLANTTAKGIPSEWKIKAPAKNIKWKAELGSLSYGGPVIAGGKIFVGTNNENPRDPAVKGDKGIVMCFNAADGKFLWQAVHNKIGEEANDWSKQGIASSPAVDGDRLYYVSNRCELVCAKTADGTAVWKLDMMKDLKVYPRYLANSSPLVAGDLVFAITGNGVNEHFKLPAPEAASFVAVDKKTGKPKWTKNYPGANVMDGQWTNPAYAVVKGNPQVIFPGGDGWLYGLDAANGDVIWKFNCNPKKAEFKPLGRGDKHYFLATPVIHDDKAYIGVGLNPEDGTGAGHLWCVDITKTGDVSAMDDNFDPAVPANAKSALVWHFGGKAAAGADRDYTFGRTLSTCAIHEGLCYVADLDGFIYCLDAKTGKKYWDHDFKATVWSSPYYADGKVYIGTDDGDVHVFAAGKDKKLLGTNEMERPVKGPVVVAGGVLYVMTDSALYAIQTKEK
jgi:outer membrane protein assembly factor BamB